MATFNEENIKDLSHTCEQLTTLLEQHTGGSLMYSQLEFLGELIKKFVKNPIVETSGIIKR